MIIRKPYAFIIKHFKLIHFFILLLSSYILFVSFNILDFFNEYVDTRQFLESETLVTDIVPASIVIFSILLILLSTLIMVLFRKKEKPTMFYIASVIYYFILIVLCFVSRSTIKTIMFDGIDPRISRIIRDMWLISVMLQFAVVIFSLVRTLGFDIKKFNFGEDLHELQIEDEDSEEVEINSRFNADKVRMSIRMQRHEFKSFFYENKFIIIFIAILSLVIIPSAFIAKNIVENKRYQVGEIIDLKGFNFTIEEAYTTKRDYNGKQLLKGDTSYLILKLNLTNLEEKERGIKLNNLRLEVNNKIYVPKTNYYDYFEDLGIGYENNEIPKGTKNYIAVYIINDEDLNNELIVRYADKITVKKSQANAKYYRFIITPENLDSKKTSFNQTIRNDIIVNYNKENTAKLNISHYNVSDKFTYELNGKTKYIINNVGLVMMLNYEFTSESITFKDFIDKYIYISYKYKGNIYKKKINNITPSYYKDKSMFISVSENMKDVTEISLVVQTRNSEYIYKLK